MTAMLLIDGYKTLSHKDLIDYLKENYSASTEHEISIVDDLRILRNRIVYDGFFIDNSYLIRNESLFKMIIDRLRN